MKKIIVFILLFGAYTQIFAQPQNKSFEPPKHNKNFEKKQKVIDAINKKLGNTFNRLNEKLIGKELIYAVKKSNGIVYIPKTGTDDVIEPWDAFNPNVSSELTPGQKTATTIRIKEITQDIANTNKEITEKKEKIGNIEKELEKLATDALRLNNVKSTVNKVKTAGNAAINAAPAVNTAINKLTDVEGTLDDQIKAKTTESVTEGKALEALKVKLKELQDKKAAAEKACPECATAAKNK
ncbi:MAG: hypothetical protein LBJ63_10280 [Prevotellaceae bacterium]|jgi:hypothetical protein|nr:hypothetical protein [Prevotellaceae bacterium]